MEHKKTKLNTGDYVFESHKEDLNNVYLEYEYGYLTKVDSTDAKSEETIEFTIYGDDKNHKTIILSFIMQYDAFINLPAEITQITSSIISTAFLIDPNSDKNGPLDISLESEMYANPANLWGASLDEDDYFIKLAIPEESIFIWFNCNLK